MTTPILLRWITIRTERGNLVALTPHEYSNYRKPHEVVWSGVASDHRAATFAGESV